MGITAIGAVIVLVVVACFLLAIAGAFGYSALFSWYTDQRRAPNFQERKRIGRGRRREPPG